MALVQCYSWFFFHFPALCGTMNKRQKRQERHRTCFIFLVGLLLSGQSFTIAPL